MAKVSDIPTAENQGQDGSRRTAISGRIGNFMSKKLMAQQIEHEPVSEKALELGQFINAHIAPERLRFLTFSAAGAKDGQRLSYPTDTELEFHHHDKREDHGEGRPVANALLKLYGRDYREGPAPEGSDVFMCTLAAINLDDGSRIIQAAPFDFEGPSYGYEYDGMRAALRELFGDSSDLKDLEGYARISLGSIDQEGNLTPLRPFNQHAFGVDIVPILDRLTGKKQENDIWAQIQDGKIHEFSTGSDETASDAVVAGS